MVLLFNLGRTLVSLGPTLDNPSLRPWFPPPGRSRIH